MSDVKEKVLAIIQQLPDTATYDDILDVILLQKKVNEGINQLDQGKGIEFEDFKAHVLNRLQCIGHE
jgi:hypothetical protein